MNGKKSRRGGSTSPTTSPEASLSIPPTVPAEPPSRQPGEIMLDAFCGENLTTADVYVVGKAFPCRREDGSLRPPERSRLHLSKQVRETGQHPAGMCWFTHDSHSIDPFPALLSWKQTRNTAVTPQIMSIIITARKSPLESNVIYKMFN